MQRWLDRIWPPALLFGVAAWLYRFNSTTDGDLFVLWGIETVVGRNLEAQSLATVGIIAGTGLVSLVIGITRLLLEGDAEDDDA